MRIHKEGVIILIVSFAVLVGLNFILHIFSPALSYYFLIPISVLLMFFMLRFFRVPRRNTKPDNNCIFSPADGTVVAIEEVDEHEALNTRCLQISVFMSIWNVHINWIPTNGTVRYFKYHPGDYLVAWHPKSSTHNERTTVVVEREDGVKVLLRQIAGAVARRIVCYAEPDKAVEQFSELGFIKFGSRVDVLLPINANVEVKIGDKVTGNISILAKV
ncbi:MAG TPA: phosphatidylserine decarboxylase family protein [Tenuifilaceae bacterium]|nr:phosphatidylserine decarboxylase family protein [Tenuifilaceae bacterium]